MWIHFKGRLLALPENIRLELKWLIVANTLAYYDAAEFTAVKSFIVQALGVNPIKLFMALIYVFSE